MCEYPRSFLKERNEDTVWEVELMKEWHCLVWAILILPPTSYLLLYPLSKCQSWIVVNHIIAQCNKRMNEWMNETIHESPSALGRAVESTRDIHSCKLPVRILTWPCWFEWPWLDSWILTAQAYGWRDHRDEAMKLWGQACKSGAKKRLCRLGWHWEEKKLNSIQRWASHLVDCTRGTSCWRRLRFT